MNKTRTLIMAVVCAAMPAVTHAQENLIKAFDDFLNNKSNSEYIKTDMYVENNSSKGGMTYSYYHTLDMPANKEKEIDKLRAAFNKDIDKAYKVMIKSAGSQSLEKMRVAYGSNNEKNIDFGYYPQHNYMVMLVHDKLDSLKRYCYAIVWYKDSATNRLRGSLHKIYGKDPAKVMTIKRYETTITSHENTWSPSGNTEVRIYGSDGNTSVVVYNDSIKSDIDFLQRFGNLTVAYKDKIREIVSEESLVIGICNKILALCNNYSFLLTKTEKETCIETLRNLPRTHNGIYVNGILKEAMNALKESNGFKESYKKALGRSIGNKTMKLVERSMKEWQ